MAAGRGHLFLQQRDGQLLAAEPLPASRGSAPPKTTLHQT